MTTKDFLLLSISREYSSRFCCVACSTCKVFMIHLFELSINSPLYTRPYSPAMKLFMKMNK
jgi:hypothetical protein